jgi:hypothetical protein
VHYQTQLYCDAQNSPNSSVVSPYLPSLTPTPLQILSRKPGKSFVVFYTMSYLPIKTHRSSLDTIREPREVGIEDGSGTCVESGQAEEDGKTSLVKQWTANSISRLLSRNLRPTRRARDDSAAWLLIRLVPWILNVILIAALVSLSWKKGGTRPLAPLNHLPRTDLLWSKVSAYKRILITNHFD